MDDIAPFLTWVNLTSELCSTNYRGPECSESANLVAVDEQTVVLFGGQSVQPGIQISLNSLWVFRKKPTMNDSIGVGVSPTTGGAFRSRAVMQ